MSYEIEKDIEVYPISKTQFKPRESKYPFRDMEVGDSFAVEPTKNLAIRSAITNFQKRNPDVKFVTRRGPDGEIRIWRSE